VAPAGPVASAAPASETARRVGPRVDASWAGNAPPPYPAAARRMGEQGEVRLDVHVGADGSVIDVQVRASSGSPALDRSAMDAVRRWRFRPATVDGQAVSEWYRDWKWVFRLEG
jgi:protein TonB